MPSRYVNFAELFKLDLNAVGLVDIVRLIIITEHLRKSQRINPEQPKNNKLAHITVSSNLDGPNEAYRFQSPQLVSWSVLQY